MGKQIKYSDSDSEMDQDIHASNLIDELEIDDEAFFAKFEKSNRKKSKRSKDARRLIEQYWEERELADRLDDYYYHTDD